MAIAACLVDTNILLRIARRSDPQHKVIDAAFAKLALEGTILLYTHQNIAELWNVMTRPVTRNGFGLAAAEAEREVRVIEAGMSLLPDSEAIYREWRRIVVYSFSSPIRRPLTLDRLPGCAPELFPQEECCRFRPGRSDTSSLPSRVSAAGHTFRRRRG